MAGKSLCMLRFRFMAEMFSALSAVFLFGLAFVCFCARLTFHYLTFYSTLGSLIEQSLMATAMSRMAE